MHVIAAYDERQRDDSAIACARLHPARAVRAHDHLAPPQQVQFIERQRRWQAIDNPVTCTAGLQREHEPRLIGRPARCERAQAKTAMQSMDGRRACFRNGEQRIPQQRAIGEHPPAGALRLFRKRRRERSRQLLVGQCTTIGHCGEIQLAHLTLFEVAARQRHRLFGSFGIARRLGKRHFRLAPLGT